MHKLRIGKDFAITWPIYSKTGGEKVPYVIDAKNAELKVHSPFGYLVPTEVRFTDNLVKWIFRGKDQEHKGVYNLELVVNDGKDGMVTVDTCKAFALVGHSCEESVDAEGGVLIDAVMLDGSEVSLAPVVLSGESYDDTELREMIAEQDTKLTELSAEIGGLSAAVNGEIYDGAATEATFILTNELKEGDSLTISVDKTYNAGALSFLDANGAEIHMILFSQSVSANYTIPSNYAKLVLKWGANWDNLKIVKSNNIKEELAKKIEGINVGVGKNLYDARIIEDGYINVSQTIGAKPSYVSNANAGYGHSSPIPVVKGLTYHIKADSVCGGFYKLFLDANGNVVELVGQSSGAVNTANNISLVVPNNADFLVLTTRFGGVDCTNLQVEMGDVATEYESYKEIPSLPIEQLPTYVQEATRVALENKPKVERLESLLMTDGGLKVYASAGDSLTEGSGVAVGTIDLEDGYYPLSGSPQKTYAYMIAKRYKMAWRNYGISGSTMSNIFFNGQSHSPFCADRYANMADNIDVISLWFGVNDSYYGKLAKAEEWLSKTYGKKMYYPLSASQQGTTASDGTPFATNEQYMACISAKEEFNGVSYEGFDLYKKQFIGLSTDTDDSTWWGAWNKVLPYLIEKYPFAKILIITGYGTEKYLYESAKEIAEKYGVLHLDLREYGVTWLDGSTKPSVIDYDAADFADRTYFKEYASGKVSVNEFRKRTMLYDGLHFNKYGYEYITPFIEKALNFVA